VLQLRDIAERPDRDSGSNFDRMTIKLTRRERHTILAALQRWLSYPAAREADSIATNGGKHKPLDNAEIQRLCKRITQIERKRGVGLLLRQSDNGAPEQKRPKLRHVPGLSAVVGKKVVQNSKTSAYQGPRIKKAKQEKPKSVR
jgi:hypothetical protein